MKKIAIGLILGTVLSTNLSLAGVNLTGSVVDVASESNGIRTSSWFDSGKSKLTSDGKQSYYEFYLATDEIINMHCNEEAKFGEWSRADEGRKIIPTYCTIDGPSFSYFIPLSEGKEIFNSLKDANAKNPISIRVEAYSNKFSLKVEK